jgi:hypothetical protein
MQLKLTAQNQTVVVTQFCVKSTEKPEKVVPQW